MGTFKFGGSTVVTVFKNGFPLASDGSRWACLPKQSGCDRGSQLPLSSASNFAATEVTPRVTFDDDLTMHSLRLVETVVKVGQSVGRVTAHLLQESDACAVSGVEC